jgi:bifunctional enzyme CysN/CysC
VDDGKSTLIGRLLHDSQALADDQLAELTRASRRRHGDGHDLDLALVTDGLRAEREAGITIDVAYRFFATPRRAFVIADAPGHVAHTRNMLTGASTADLAVVLVDVRRGPVRQTRRHLFLASLLGVRHVVVVVNKMDLVGWDEARFDAVVRDVGSYAARLDVVDLAFIPVSALHGDNVVARSPNAPWYAGPPLLDRLEHVHIASDRNLRDARLPVQWVVRAGTADGDDRRGYAGRLAGGVWRPGDEVVVLPSGARSRVAAIDTYDGPLQEAFPPMSVTLRLADDLDVSRGDVICRPGNRAGIARDIDAMLCWMGPRAAAEGQRYLIKHTTRTARALLRRIAYRVDIDTLHRDESVAVLAANDVGRVHLRANQALLFDSYARNRETGAFILIDEISNDTVAAGMILGGAPAAAEPARPRTRSENVTWQPPSVTAEERARALGHRGATIWMTGLPAAGKSTLAAGVERALVARGRPALRLDGDNLRHGLTGDLGFEAADRAENVRRTAHAARLLAEASVVAVVALVSPYAADRALARRIHEQAAIPFIEVFVDTPLEECERRDPRGLYEQARRGELPGFTGVSDPYEAPGHAEVTLRPAPLDVLVQAALDALDAVELARPG